MALLSYGRSTHSRLEREVKRCAIWHVALSPQAAAVRADDGLANCKAHSKTVLLGGIEWLENTFDHFRRHPFALVNNANAHGIREVACGGDNELSIRRRTGLHRITAIDNEVK